MSGDILDRPEAAESPVARAQGFQRQAATPTLNVFVSANAGSGKTRVLVDRVVRLLRTGVDPSKILCLTYTKAAANEMQGRLFDRLGKWSVMADAELAADLADLDPDASAPSADALRAARALFARALETPGGLKVQTIHAFCERLLRRFPIEAGVEPGFEILDDAQSAEAARRARARMAVEAAAAGGEPLRVAFAFLAARLDDEAIEGFLDWAVRSRAELRDAFAQRGGREAMLAALAGKLGVPVDADADALKAEGWATAPRDDLRAALGVLRASSASTDKAQVERLAAALDAETPDRAFDLYKEFVFTGPEGDKTPRDAIATKKTLDLAPSLLAHFGAKGEEGSEIVRMLAARDRVRAADVLALTRAALMVAETYLGAFEAEKALRQALDFSDLIDAARQLVRASAAADWVRYKLDGGVEHVLVDEAQDTSPVQWDLIGALTEEFYAGAGAADAVRTTFIVGDEKQSIYSFQGAEPSRFLTESQNLSRRADEAGADFKAVSFTTSFRCAPEVLAAVDATFGLPETRTLVFGADGAPTTTDLVSHAAARRAAPGLVEWWPLEPRGETVERASHWAPVDALPRNDARVALADRVARTVRDWIAAGEGVADRDAEREGVVKMRPMRPGDVMILVRKRDAVFETVIRKLKAYGVPVAGADRMTLREQLAVEDLLGAARVALLPEDDLALAEFLKSPLVQPSDADAPVIDEEALFELAYGRGGVSLWDRLRETRDPRFAEARALVTDLAARAQHEGPFAFLSGLLDRRAGPDGAYARRLYARLGPEAEDPVEELLGRALAHERRSAPSLERFVHETLAEELEVKREGSDAADVVRVMTVHGAKGLEAPVVIVPDLGLPGGGGRDIAPFLDAEGDCLWSPVQSIEPALATARREARARAADAERLRQLYVAMTRAEDRLVLCAYEPGKGRYKDDCWHALVERSLRAAGAEEFETPNGPGLRLGAPRKADAPAPRTAESGVVVPAWARAPLAVGVAGPRYVTPTQGLRVAARPPAVLSPLAEGGADRFRRGRLVHKLLEFLPDLDRDRREEAARRCLGAEGEFDDATAEELLGEVFAILDDPAFADLFGPQSRGEAPLAGSSPYLPEGVIVRGRVDRLAITASEVLIVDYKTDRPPPARAEDVDSVYLEQMAAYRALLRALHPDKPVRAALLWTDGPRLMALPEALLDEALARA